MTGGGHEVLRVAERALLVRFLDDDLATAVARAQRLARALGPAGEIQGFSVQDKDKDKDVSVERKDQGRERDGDQGRGRGRGQDQDRGQDRDRGLAGAELVLGAGNLLVKLPSWWPELDVERWRGRLEKRLAAASFDEGAGLASDLTAGAGAGTGAREHLLAVRYGGEEGPDLEATALSAGVSAARVVELHAGALYTVAFVGFSPGFGYLLGLPPALEVSRLATPRARVPAGSVALAGPFTGVYPAATPGGWRLIGRTDAALFSPAWPRPALLAPGDRVRFVAVR